MNSNQRTVLRDVAISRLSQIWAQKAKQGGLARQSVAEVPSVEGTVALKDTASHKGGGFPHEPLLQEPKVTAHCSLLIAESSSISHSTTRSRPNSFAR